MDRIETDQAPPPAGHYSQAVVHAGLAYVSGQLPIEANGNVLGGAPVEEQTRAVLANIDAILQAAGSGLGNVLQMTIYVSDMDHWSAVNRAYIEVMGEHRPARAVVPVKDLHHGVALEVQAIAAV